MGLGRLNRTGATHQRGKPRGQATGGARLRHGLSFQVANYYKNCDVEGIFVSCVPSSDDCISDPLIFLYGKSQYSIFNVMHQNHISMS
jgi:hypothetical protein